MTSAADALRLAIVETRFTRRRHPAWQQVREGTRQWIVDQRLLDADTARIYADALHYTDLIADYYLGAPPAILRTIADFSTWFFAWDDFHHLAAAERRDRAWRHLVQRMRQAVMVPDNHSDDSLPLVAALADCLVRFYSNLGRSWNDRFGEHFLPVIDAYDREYRNLVTGRVPTVAEYVELRRLTFAHWLWVDLLEPVARHELPRQVRQHDAYQRAALATQDFAAWCNDLYSLPKELAAGDIHNFAISLMHHEGATEHQAREQLRDRLVERVEDFLTAEQQLDALAVTLPEPVAAALRSCLSNLRNWFPSVYWFHHESARYRIDQWTDPTWPPYVKAPREDS